jgi:hypothetical protein
MQLKLEVLQLQLWVGWQLQAQRLVLLAMQVVGMQV